MRVAHVINDLRVGGTEHLLVRHVAELCHRHPGIDNRVIVLGDRSDADQAYIEALGCAPIFLNFSGSYRRLRDSARCLRRLHAELSSFAPDVVHSYLWNANVFVGILALWKRRVHVVHIVDRRGDRRASRLMPRIKLRLTAWILKAGNTRFVAVSDACREHIAAQWIIDPVRVVVAHNGIDVTRFRNDQPAGEAGECNCIGVLSNFSFEKGHEVLFRALRNLLDEAGNFRLLVAGGGTVEDIARLEALVTSMELSDCVDFVGRVDDVSEFYARLDVFVVPSVSAEGLPTTILEAMASGLPVVATRVGGAIEVITDSKDGLLVEPRDSAALACAIKRVMSSSNCALRLGSAARRRVEEHFTTQRMTQIIVDSVYAQSAPALAGRKAADIF